MPARARRAHLDPRPVGGIQRRAVELGAPAWAKQIADRGVHALLGQHRMHPGLEPGPYRDQLGPVTHQLAQLADRRRGKPGLRQPAHPQ